MPIYLCKSISSLFLLYATMVKFSSCNRDCNAYPCRLKYLPSGPIRSFLIPATDQQFILLKIIGNSKVLLFVLYFLVFTVLLLRDVMCLGLSDKALFFRVVYAAGNLEIKMSFLR